MLDGAKGLYHGTFGEIVKQMMAMTTGEQNHHVIQKLSDRMNEDGENEALASGSDYPG